MKRILIIIGIVFAILLAGIVTLPFLIPGSVYKAQIEKAATGALGRDVTLIGDPKIGIFPSISARIEGAEVANPDGFSAPLMIEAGSLKASVKLWPLLSRRVEISEIALADATVRLERLSDGRANWDFGTGEPPEPAPEGEPAPSGSFQTGIDRASLSNAAVYYSDAIADQQYALTNFNATAQLKALDKPFSSKGDGFFNGQAFDYDVRLETLQDLTEAKPVSLRADLGTIYGDVGYDGALTLAEAPVLDGSFNLKSDTIGQVLTVLGGTDLPIVTSALKSVEAKGTIKGPAATAVLET